MIGLGSLVRAAGRLARFVVVVGSMTPLLVVLIYGIEKLSVPIVAAAAALYLVGFLWILHRLQQGRPVVW